MLSPNIPNFKQSLMDLWAKPEESSTIFQTADLIEALWANAVVTGYEISPCAPVPFSTYPGFTPLAPGNIGTEETAAICFEAACLQMVQATLFPIIPPALTTPPPIFLPGGLATPGLLTTLLTTIFLLGSSATVAFQTADQVADAIAGYLQGWTILVTIPPAGPIPVPIS